MSDKSVDNKPTEKLSDSQPDESLGLEHLPQTELDASPGGGDEQTSDTENINDAGVATTGAVKPVDKDLKNS